MKTKEVWLSIGSNIPDGDMIISQVHKDIRTILINCFFSTLYKTKALNGISPDYFNCVAYGLTSQELSDLKIIFKNLEKSYGRTQESKSKGLIELDIDIVLFEGEIIKLYDYENDYFQKGYLEIKNKRR